MGEWMWFYVLGIALSHAVDRRARGGEDTP
jgi:hypothetical protein